MSGTKGRQMRVAIVGGGMAGLECALEAARRGCSVEIIEAGPKTRTHHVKWDTSVHPGDEKSRSWTSDGWGPGAGLSERLGGRSLCYHGVLLEIDPQTLPDWGALWQQRLCGDGCLYTTILERLRPEFPELHPNGESAGLSEFGLEHVPQAARLDASGRFEAYSPLAAVGALVDSGRVKVTHARATAVLRGADRRWDVEVASGDSHTRLSGFDACVLAASAIGNVQILARSLCRHILTTVTDHFCVGAFVRLRRGKPLTPFRHPMLWSGFAKIPELGTNIFFLDHPSLSNGDRLVEMMAVVEQQGGPARYSELTVRLLGEGANQTHIRAKVSAVDEDQLDQVRARVQRWAEALAGEAVEELRPLGAAQPDSRTGKHDGTDLRWFGYDAAREALVRSGRSNVFSPFELPYGAFEHEACTHPYGGTGAIPVSTELEVLELPGVYVAGPGIFPRLGAGNPALTIMATSNWLGGFLAEGR